jgi:hypothetical protein
MTNDDYENDLRNLVKQGLIQAYIYDPNMQMAEILPCSTLQWITINLLEDWNKELKNVENE